MTTSEKPRKVAVASLTTRETMQPRRQLNADAVRRYAQAFQATQKNPFPPILVARLTDQPGGTSSLVVIDGHHRLQAARMARVERIEAQVIEVTTARAEWLAAKANAEHGVPLKSSERQEVFRRYVRAGENRAEDGRLKSYREIAADLARPHQTCARWMRADFPTIAAEMGGRDEEQQAEVETPDNARFTEEKFTDYAEGVQRLARAMQGAQRRAVDEAPQNADRTTAEKNARADARSRDVLLGGLDGILRAIGEALGTDDPEVLAKLVAERRDALLDGDF